MGEEVKVGDLVWAKMKGFSPWPGKVTLPVENMKRPKSSKVLHCIFFFGSENFAWIEEDKIKPYVEYKDKLEKTCKTVPFKEACLAIAEYKKRKDAGEIIDEFEGTISGQLSQTNSTLSPADSSTPSASPIKSDTALETPTSTNDTFENQTPPPSLAAQTTPIPKNKRKKVPSKLENGESSGTANRAVTAKKRRESTEPKSTKPRAPKQQASQKVVNNVTPVIRKSAGASLLDRPTLSRPDAAPLNVMTISQTLKNKKIEPSNMKFGFLGLGIMGAGMVKNLLNSGHRVLVWNRTPEKCKQFVDAGADQAMTPSDVISGSDVTFSCVSDPVASKEMVFGNCGVLLEMDATKGFVEMTTTDSEASQDIAEAIGSKGGRYLEAQVQGSKCEAEEGTLVILAAGERSLYEDCQSTFQAMGKHSFFLGDVGNASKMNLVLQLMIGSSLAILAEGMALADRAGLQQRDVLEILELTRLNCPLFRDKGAAIIDGGFPTQQPLQHMQKDLNLALQMGNQLEQPLPLAATANEIYKHAKRLGYGEHDASAVYIRARF